MTHGASAVTLAAEMLPLEAPIHRLSFDDVITMYDSGVLGPEERVELIDGVLVDMSPTGPAHSTFVARLTRHFVRALEHEVRVQDTFRIRGGFFQPDLMVVDRPAPTDQPTTAYLVIEVSVTSQRHDRFKASRYAEAGVDEYWIVDEPARIVIVHRRPRESGYREVVALGFGAAIEPLVGGPPVVLQTLVDPATP